jgi:hypothetical protein
MCKLCKKYGKDRITDESRLKEATAVAAEYLEEVSDNPDKTEHIMEAIDLWLDGVDEESNDAEAVWESNRRAGKLP